MVMPASTFVSRSAALFVGAVVIAGCSGSSDSGSPDGDEPTDADPQAVVGDGGSNAPDADPPSNDPAAPTTEPPTPGTQAPDTPAPETPDPDVPPPETPPPETSEPEVPEPGTPVPEAPESQTPEADPESLAVPEPEIENTIRVDYEITVPAYVSDALLVTLVRGEDEVAATWIGDELWSATEVLPTNTETSPTVTFHDDDGGLTLGTAELSFRTGTNAMQIVRVSAEQFDTARWDDDRGGASNLDESVAGTDPRVDETGELERRETFNPFNAAARPTALEALERASAFHESSLPEAFPYVESVREEPPEESYGYETPGYVFLLEADLDASGNGDFARYDQTIEPDDNTIVEEQGTRAVVDGRIEWEGTYARINVSSGVRNRFEFAAAFERLEGSMRRQRGTTTYDTFGTTSDDTAGVPITVSWALVGEPIEDSPDCLPSAGRVDYDVPGPRSADPAADTVVAKDVGDEYWRVTTTGADGRVVEDFLVRSLGTVFHCDYRG